ncbi:MAG: transcriptional regulator [Zetaproteobacteria bacterium CG12_big_fil_rev_8_21_14_0_65_54_13]|nr:MAG: transcriptional regulator [Zetaproteobacteria bacterium CG12_big_fil_rev_8_21_14_0_65_54_13]PJA28240.1 MAG: transcriptional regulator [Zetaproteobacteria bacterium CG_4_9_14_3_um_filter_54_145]
MDKFDRIQQLHRILVSHRYPVSTTDLCRQLECSRATLNRSIDYMITMLAAPIVNSRGKGYFYDPHIAFELPGLWFTAEELYSLLSMRKLLDESGPGVLQQVMAPVQKRIERLLERNGRGGSTEMARIRILSMMPRSCSLPYFSRVSTAVLERKRLSFSYAGRGDNQQSQREVSPQRLTHYRDNWYLDAFCHLRNGLRTFSLECMAGVYVQETLAAMDVDEVELNLQLGSAYGIFAGVADKVAVLRFAPQRARWVADEAWHPQQESRWLEDGSYELHIPYANATELVMDTCRHGPEVEVIEPQSLRDAVAGQLKLAAARYD